ncbi:Synaptobrevin-like YKT6 [Hondaea fermentalgiana]|uniref:Synaptobrevin-like YKT6 n=1 Tax=Hondaea fermentalgiana TaxID=2315210 RepID=A0A2R5G452_9STRA|nr:Synaptobrevin-like YKT6 [Hondaea fermentalgiana]|eukprot:GBG24558.1 Synaptobrevin-like YKT6 [Hondaea fermentalgiana]
MKITGISILKWKEDTAEPVFLASATELSSFGFFQRGTAAQFVKFISRTLIKRTPAGKRQTVEHEGNNVHTYLRSDGLGCAVVADAEYPERVAFTIMSKLIEQFHSQYAQQWPTVMEDATLSFEPLDQAIIEYQDPSKADKISKIQKDLDATMEVMHKTIDSVLERQVKLDKLVETSEDLSMQSKAFYTTAKSHNQCCTIC